VILLSSPSTIKKTGYVKATAAENMENIAITNMTTVNRNSNNKNDDSNCKVSTTKVESRTTREEENKNELLWSRIYTDWECIRERIGFIGAVKYLCA